ncbi:MAG: UDP-N-acetylmuramoyl-tripeptide--D-alanyl-D-alanine ligase [Planctomycetota bacterium]|nr:UDP-N-acetylmuramoyl-tripeptide--D-alanyl-D-alanine ligase [Planctomycetota bacterium]
MMPLTLEEIRKAANAEVQCMLPGVVVKRVHTDSRTVQADDLFIALEGKKFDGHAFVGGAIRRGAVAAIVSRPLEGQEVPEDFPILHVGNTLTALGDIARYYLSHMSARIIAVGGSNGKTTTKDMIAHILSKDRRVVKSPRSFNNDIGLPLTALTVSEDTEYAVLEMGTNAPREIANLCSIAPPHVGVLTSISEEHLEGLVDLPGVARANGELLDALSESNFAVLNKDNKWIAQLMRRCKARIVTFGVYSDANVRGAEILTDSNKLSFVLQGRHHVDMRVLGSWNVYNALAATAVANLEGVELAEIAGRLADFKPPSMRMEPVTMRNIDFINDAYNANPRSMSMAIDEFLRTETPARKILVLGDMCELGGESRGFHEKLGERLADADAHAVFLYGREMRFAMERASLLKRKNFHLVHFFEAAELTGAVYEYLKEGDLVLLKGSRAMELERVLEPFKCATRKLSV